MTFPFPLPDWLPWWTTFAVLVPLGLYLLAFMLMPFSVFGLKGRLEAVEARLDEIQGEIRSLSLRLPEPADFDREPMMRPPIPPASRVVAGGLPESRTIPPRPVATLPDRAAPAANLPPSRPAIVRRPDAVRPDVSRNGRSEPSFDPR